MNADAIAIVIVAWNQLDKTLDCLASVAALRTPPGRVVLVDNGSAPPLAEMGRYFTPASWQLLHEISVVHGSSAIGHRGSGL